MRLFVFVVAAVVAAVFAGCQSSALPAQQASSTAAPASLADTVRVEEVFLTPRDTSENVDSPAVWHGSGGRHWLLATAKEGDVIRIHDAATGAPIRRIGGSGTGAGQLDRPNGIAVVGDLLVVVERNNRRLQVFSLPEGESLGTFGRGRLRRPYGITAFETSTPGTYTAYVTDNYEAPGEQIPQDAELGERVKQFRFSVEEGRLQHEHVRTFGETSGPGVLRKVESLWADPERGRLLIAEEKEGESQIKMYDLEGRFERAAIPPEYFPHEAEGIVLYACPAGGSGSPSGYWLTTDQGETGNTFHVFGRRRFTYEGSFRGRTASNTDGIAVTQRRFGPFEQGAFYAVHDDGNTAAFSWADIAGTLGLRSTCEPPQDTR